MNSGSRSTLFLIEQLIVILVFAICAAVCARIFADAYTISKDSAQRRSALIIAASAAESFKAAKGDIVKTAEILGAPNPRTHNAIEAFYDEQGRPCAAVQAKYLLRVVPVASSGALIQCGISVSELGGDEILKFASGVVDR